MSEPTPGFFQIKLKVTNGAQEIEISSPELSRPFPLTDEEFADAVQSLYKLVYRTLIGGLEQHTQRIQVVPGNALSGVR